MGFFVHLSMPSASCSRSIDRNLRSAHAAGGNSFEYFTNLNMSGLFVVVFVFVGAW